MFDLYSTPYLMIVHKIRSIISYRFIKNMSTSLVYMHISLLNHRVYSNIMKKVIGENKKSDEIYICCIHTGSIITFIFMF